MRYLHFPGVGKRMTERLLALGYVTAAGKPAYALFIREKGFDPRYFYAWLKGRTPSGANLEKLVADLETTKGWLLHEEGAPGPFVAVGRKFLLLFCLGLAALLGIAPRDASSGVLSPAGTLAAPDSHHTLLLIGSWRRLLTALRDALTITPRGADNFVYVGA